MPLTLSNLSLMFLDFGLDHSLPSSVDYYVHYPCPTIVLVISSNFTLVAEQTHVSVCLVFCPPTGKEKQDASEGNGDAMEQGVLLRSSQKYCPKDNAMNPPFRWPPPSFFYFSCLCFCPGLIPIYSSHTIQNYHLTKQDMLLFL